MKMNLWIVAIEILMMFLLLLVLASIEFIAWGEGTTKLALQNLQIRDIDGEELKAFTITNGEIKVGSGSEV